MSDRTRRPRPPQGVSIWLDDISRERLRTGNLQSLDRRASTSSASPPTRRSSRRRWRRATPTTSRSATSPSAGSRVEEAVRLLTTLRRPLGLRRAAAGLRRDRRRRRPGVDRGRPAARPRHRHDHRRGQGAVVAGRPAQPAASRSRRPRRACPRSPRRIAEGISVNVTLIFSLERYDGGHGRLPRPAWSRPRPTGTTCRRSTRWPRSSSPASTPRSTSGWTRSAPTRRRRCAARPAIANARLAYQRYEKVFATDRWKALAAAGRARRSGRCGPRPASRTPPTTTRCTSSSWSRPDTVNTMPETTLDAVADHGEIRGDTDHRHATTSAQAVLDDLAALGIDYDDVVAGARGRGRGEVRGLLGRAARRVCRHASSSGRPDQGTSPVDRHDGRVTDGHRRPRRADGTAPADHRPHREDAPMTRPTRCATRGTGGCPRVPEPCALVIFGVTGDLARKKLMPAIYDLANRGLLPPDFALLGFARRDWGDGDFAAAGPRRRPRSTPARRAARRSGSGWPSDIRFVPGLVRRRRRVRHAGRDARRAATAAHGIQGNAAFYLSIPPAMFPVVLKQMERTGMADNEHGRRLAPGGGREAVRARPAKRARAERAGRRRVHRRTTCSASTTTWARRPSRTCWRCGSPTSCSSRSGTPTTSTRCRSRWPRTSASAAGPAFYDADRRGPRRAAEPPAAAARADRDGGAGRVRRRGDPHREAQGAAGDHAARRDLDDLRGPRAVRPGLAGRRAGRRLPRRRRASRRTRRPRPTPRSGSASRPAAGPACRSTCAPASGCRAGSPRSRSCSRRRRTCRSPTPTPRSWATTSWSSGCSRTRASRCKFGSKVPGQRDGGPRRLDGLPLRRGVHRVLARRPTSG